MESRKPEGRKREREGQRGEQTERGGATINGNILVPPNGEPLSRGSPKTQRRAPGSETRASAFLGDTREGVECGVGRPTLQLGHRAVRFPCGQARHVLHARCTWDLCERRGTGTTLLPSSQLRNPEPETWRIGRSSPIGSGPLQSGIAEGREGHRRRGPTQPGSLVRRGRKQPPCRVGARRSSFRGPAPANFSRKRSAAAPVERTRPPGHSPD